MKKNLALLFSVIIFTALIGFGFFGINGVLAADVNWSLDPGSTASGALDSGTSVAKVNGVPNNIRDNDSTTTYYEGECVSYITNCNFSYSALVTFPQAVSLNKVEIAHRFELGQYSPSVSWIVALNIGGNWLDVMTGTENTINLASTKTNTQTGSWSNVSAIRIKATGKANYGSPYNAVARHYTYELRAFGPSLPVPPTVTTSPASDVSSYYAQLNGTANPNGFATTAWFRYSSTNPGSCNDTFGYRYPELTNTQKSLGSGTSSVSFNTAGVGLSHSRTTTYYYCAIAENSGGKGFGSIVSYTTRDVSTGVNPASGQIVLGKETAVSTTVTVTHVSGGPNVGPVDFSISGLPSGVTAAFSLSSCTPTCNSTLTFTAGGGATPGVYPITIEATDKYLSIKQIYKTTYTLTIAKRTLTVTKSSAGAANGTVTSSPSGINCGADCSEVYNYGTSVTLTASNTNGAVFLNWTGACTGSGTTCTVNIDADKSVNAAFGQTFNTKTLTVSKSGSGSGTVTSSPAGINCGADCSENYIDGTSVTLTASVSGGSTFTGWSGAGCSGTGICVVTMNSAQSVTANFNANSPGVSTNPVSSVTANGAALNGSANPNGLATSAWFEWGTSASLSTFNTTSPTQNLGSGTSAVSYSASISGLSSGATYYFRAAASNSSGTSKGTILNFTTVAVAAPGVSVVPTNLTVIPGDSCVAALQPTLSWDLSSAMWFSKGWAWSTNIRWISFNSSNCDTDNDGTSNGGSGCPVAGTAMSAYSVKIDSGNGNFSGYAWSSRIGWISFGDYNGDGAINSSDENISGAPCSGNCRAKLNLSNNQVTGWARVLRYKSFGGDRGWIKLSGTATNGSTYGIYKNGNNLEGYVWGSENIGWIRFNGSNYGVTVVVPTQSAYQVQVDSDPVFPFPAEVDTGKVASSGRTYTVPSGKLNYGTTYYWRAKIWDTENSESSWVNGPSFGTAAHQYPRVDFEWTPKTPSALETVEFKDKSIVYGGTSISDWLWTFQDAICKTPATGCETVQNPKITFNEVAEKSNKSVSLKVTDSDGFSCLLNKSIPVNVKLPEIKEVAPKK